MTTQIRIAHSPDADDAFMFHALLSGKIEHPGLEISEAREDIESLNQKARDGVYEVTAISFHAFPSISDKYYLLTTGACFGDRYGPIVVAPKPLKPKQLLKVHMGIPGKLTTAFLALKLYEHFVAGEAKSGICYTQVPFDQILDQVKEGKLDAGLIIHEGQLSFEESGMVKIVDLGEWWHKETDLPLPLGGIAIRKDVGLDVVRQVSALLQKSIQYGLEHKDEVLQAALPYARGLDPERALKFIEMYVNDWTVDFGRKGYKAIKTLLDRGYREGILKEHVDLDENVFDVKKGKLRSEIFGTPGEPAGDAPEAPAQAPEEESTLKIEET